MPGLGAERLEGPGRPGAVVALGLVLVSPGFRPIADPGSTSGSSPTCGTRRVRRACCDGGEARSRPGVLERSSRPCSSTWARLVDGCSAGHAGAPPARAGRTASRRRALPRRAGDLGARGAGRRGPRGAGRRGPRRRALAGRRRRARARRRGAASSPGTSGSPAQADHREQRMLAEFPTVAELLALAVSAGEGATGALDRVCRSVPRRAVRRARRLPGRCPRRCQPAHRPAGPRRPHRPAQPGPLRRRHRRRRRARHTAGRGAARPGPGRARDLPAVGHGGGRARRSA